MSTDGVNTKRKYKEEYLPSPEEILVGCLLIQAGWSEEERLMRSGAVKPVAIIYSSPGRHNGRPMGWKRVDNS